MQVFLPYPDFKMSVRCLDMKRLGKQRVECMQIVNALEGKSQGWRNHPAALMFRDNIIALKLYHNLAIKEWIKRGYKNTMSLYPIDTDNQENVLVPFFIGNEQFHRSHKSNLIRKFPEYYGQLWPGIPNDLPYIWPTNKEEN